MPFALGPLINRVRDLLDIDWGTVSADTPVLTYNPDTDKVEGMVGGSGGSTEPATAGRLGVVEITGTPANAEHPVVPVVQADGKIPFPAYEQYHWLWANQTERMAQSVSADEVGLQGIQGWPIANATRVYILTSVAGGAHWGEIDDRLQGALQASSNLGDLWDADVSLTNLGLHGTPNKVAATDPTGSTNHPVAVRALVAADIPSLTLSKISDAGTAASHAATDFDAAGAAGGVQTNLTAEAATRASADTTLQANVTSEATARASADTAEASARASGDTTNASNLATHAALTTAAHGGIVASTDSRLSDARTPTAHAASHISTGGDAIPIAVGAGASGLLSGTDKTKLDNTSGVNTGDQDISGKVDKNPAITGATKTKVTYDTKGLVTSGADATTADIADSTNKRYVTDAELTVLVNTSGVNTGDQSVPAFAAPSVALGTAAAVGSASTVIRSDSTIVAFDTTAPSTQAYGDAAAAGTAAVATRRDHKHAMPAAVTDATIAVTDVATNNVSTSAHGWAPKGDGSTTKFLNANGAYSTPAGGSTDVLMAQVFS